MMRVVFLGDLMAINNAKHKKRLIERNFVPIAYHPKDIFYVFQRIKI